MNTKDQARAPAEYHDFLDIKEATVVMNFKHDQYTRRLIHESVKAVAEGKEPKLPWADDGRPIAVKLDMGNVEKWFIHPDSAKGYTPKRAFGASGLSRWLLRFNPEKHSAEVVAAALVKALGEPGPDNYIFERAYKPGSRKGKSKSKSTIPEDYTASIVNALSRPHPSTLRATPPRAPRKAERAAAATATATAKAPAPKGKLD